MSKVLMVVIGVFTFLAAVLTHSFGDINMESNDTQKMSKYSDVVEIRIVCDIAGQGFQKLADNYYTYVTRDINEILYIIHYINSLDLYDDGMTLFGGNLPIVNMYLNTNNGMVSKIGFVDGRFYNENGIQYAVDRIDYQRFLNFIYSLKSDALILSGEVSFYPSDWAEEHVESAIKNGFLPKWFRVNYRGGITRLEFCQLVDNLIQIVMIESNKDNYADPIFFDVKDNSVTNLWNKGIVKGRSETQFSPYEYITREEFAAILFRIFKYIRLDGTIENEEIIFNDQADISNWAEDSVEFVSINGILYGDINGKFRPKDNVSKQETIVALDRLYRMNLKH